jgi:hypothetical protein
MVDKRVGVQSSWSQNRIMPNCFPCKVQEARSGLRDEVSKLLALSQAAQDVVHWRAFCTAVTAYLTTLATPVATEAEAVQADGATLYHQRIPQLAQRMQTVLASTLEDIGRQASRTALCPIRCDYSIVQVLHERCGLSSQGRDMANTIRVHEESADNPLWHFEEMPRMQCSKGTAGSLDGVLRVGF